MPSEKDLILAKLARDNRFITDEHIQECVSELLKRRDAEPGLTLARVLVEKDYLTVSQLDRLEKLRVRDQRTHLIEGYEILGSIGQGAMGAVYRARQLSMDRPVALKILSSSVLSDEDFLKRFQREARTTGRLSHPNIVQGIDVGEFDGQYYFAMEFVDGESLSEILTKKRLTEHESIDIVLMVSRALDHLHENGLVHRDVKPENIMLTRKGVAKLADLGLAKTVEGDSRLTHVGTIVGTPLYMSPEQAKGESDIDIRSDIYCLGICFFHMVTGRAPFEDMAPTIIMTKHITEDLPSIRAIEPGASREVERVIRTMCQRNRERRYQLPAELLEDLEDLLAGNAPRRASATSSTRVDRVESLVEREKSGSRSARREIPEGVELRFRFCYVPTDQEVFFALIALKNNLIEPDRLRHALDHQEDMMEQGMPRTLDDWLVEKSWIQSKHREKILHAQREGRRKERDVLFGRIAIDLGLVTKEEVARALKSQAEFKAQGKEMKLGEVMVRRGAITFHDKIQILSEQIRLTQERASQRFGAIAVDAGFVAGEVLETALAEQKKLDLAIRPRIGDLLVRMGALSEAKRSAVLRAQKRHEILGGDLRSLALDRLVRAEEEEIAEDVGSSSGIFDNLKLRSAADEACPFCGEPAKPSARVCRACGKKIR
ncbi:MAG: protein kinase [Planctomycetes bacterium]|nr:protein kinase [Planctomycetota bacterium]